MVRGKQIAAAVILSLLAVFGYTPYVYAALQQSSSTNYGVNEVNFGSGGELRACSTAYCAKQSTGELVVGSTSSTNYTARGGFNTNREEFLEVSVAGSSINLGVLDSVDTKFGSAAFSVRTFPAQGYSVVIDGQAPRSTSGYSISAMSSAAASQIGVEQYGVNLRQNTAPAIGADPSPYPNGTFAFGAAATGYNTVNNFKYVAGDTVASSPKGTGRTDFTVSFIVNIAPNTPGGAYAGRIVLIAVPTF